MSAYSPCPWVENGHPYYEGDHHRPEAGRGVMRGVYRPPNPPRRFHNDPAPYQACSNSSPGEVWNHYPTDHNHREPPQPIENGFGPVEYSMQMRGEVAPLRRDAMPPGHCGVVNTQDPNLRMGRREMNSRDSQPFSWMRTSESPHESPPCGAQHSPHETYGSHHHTGPPLRPHPPYKDGNMRHGECYRPRDVEGQHSPMDERRHPIQHDGIVYHPDGPYPTQMRQEYQHQANRGMMPTPEEKSSPMNMVYQQQAGRGSYSPSYSPSSWSTVSVGNHQDMGSPRHVGTRMGPTASPSDSYLADPQRKPFFHHSTDHRDRVQFERDSRHRDMRMDGSLLVEDHQRMPPRKEGLLPRPWPDERRYPPRCSSEDKRYGGVYMPQKNDAVDMMRDPRLNRKNAASQHVPHRQDPAPVVHQIVTEHSYCKKHVFGSESEPLPENCELKVTQSSVSDTSLPRISTSHVPLKNPIVGILKVEALPSTRKGNQPPGRTTEENNLSSEGSGTVVKEGNNIPVMQQQKQQQEQQHKQQEQQHKQQQDQQQHKQQEQQHKQQQEQQQHKQQQQEQQQQKQQQEQQNHKQQQEQQQHEEEETQQQHDTPKETDCKLEHMDTTEQPKDSQVSHHQVRRVLDSDILQVENGFIPSIGVDSTSTGSHQLSIEVCIEGFELDLDTEPESSDEESEEDVDDGCLVVSYQLNDVPDGGVQQSSKWFITPTGNNKIKISKISTTDVSVKEELCEQPNTATQIKFPSNRIQLRNGRVLPPSTLAFYASRKGPNSHSNTATPSSSRESSPEVPVRKIQRVARVLDSDDEEEKEQEKEPSCVVEKWSQQEPSSFDGLFGFQDSSPSTPLVSNIPQAMEEEEEEEAVSVLTKRAKLRPSPRKITRRRNRRKIKNVPKKSQKQLSYQPPRTEVSPNSKKKRFQDFEPVVLRTKSRTETQAMLRRQQMEREIEQHELERNQTAQPLSTEGGGNDQHELEEQDDCSSVCSATLTVSSLSSSREVDSSTKSSILDEFSPDLIARCKKVIPSRSSGDTPLHKVCRTGRYDMARYMILVESASVNAQDNAGWTPLHEACSSSNSEMAELLLHNGADANISSRDGTRPIHDAIESGCLDLVKVLISHGADPLAEFGEKTPVEYALSIDQKEIYKYLEEVVLERQKLREAQRSKEEQRRLKEKQKSCSPTSQKVANANATITSTTTRVSRKQKLLRQCEELIATIPVDGYSSSDPSFGEELDFPLFYISPIVELSETPFLPVYNFQVTFEGTNPRRHNFYLLDDILEALSLTEAQFCVQCPDTHLHQLTASEVMKQLHTHYNGQVSLPQRMKLLPRNSRLKFVPLCTRLQELLNIDIANLDD